MVDWSEIFWPRQKDVAHDERDVKGCVWHLAFDGVLLLLIVVTAALFGTLWGAAVFGVIVICWMLYGRRADRRRVEPDS